MFHVVGQNIFGGIVVKIGDDFLIFFKLVERITVQRFSLNCLQLLQFSVFVLSFF